MLSGGVPTIPFRDLKLHRRDDDLVGASFGRGFYVLDDYSPLREIAAGALDGDSQVSPVRDAWWYVPSVPGQARGRPTPGQHCVHGPESALRRHLHLLPHRCAGHRAGVAQGNRARAARGWGRRSVPGLRDPAPRGSGERSDGAVGCSRRTGGSSAVGRRDGEAGDAPGDLGLASPASGSDRAEHPGVHPAVGKAAAGPVGTARSIQREIAGHLGRRRAVAGVGATVRCPCGAYRGAGHRSSCRGRVPAPGE